MSQISSTTAETSILVISRTTELLNRFLASLNTGYRGDSNDLEVLIAWNGPSEHEHLIRPGRFPARIALRDPYHFAKNMNRLAEQSSSEFLIFTNDDIILDTLAINAAIDRLRFQPNTGIVGSCLRRSSGELAHAGIHFTSYGSAYHQLEHFAPADYILNLKDKAVPAVTGALFAMRREDFLQLRFDEDFQACGEDVALSLDTRSVLDKEVICCATMSAIHDAESTRSKTPGQSANQGDLERIRSHWAKTVADGNLNILRKSLAAAQDEAEEMRKICLNIRDEKEKALLDMAASQEAAITSLRQSEASMQVLVASMQEQIQEQMEQHARDQKQLQAKSTELELQVSQMARDMKRLISRNQQLENERSRISQVSHH